MPTNLHYNNTQGPQTNHFKGGRKVKVRFTIETVSVPISDSGGSQFLGPESMVKHQPQLGLFLPKQKL